MNTHAQPVAPVAPASLYDSAYDDSPSPTTPTKGYLMLRAALRESNLSHIGRIATKE